MQYWLFKSEPDCYSIDDLKKQGTGMWEGCRNYTVRNFMRDEMQVGDMGFFYHSNAKPPGIVGTMKVVSTGYPDPTQFDPNSEYFDPKATKENPRWYVVDVEFVEKSPEQLTLAQIKEDSVLSGMEVAKKGQMLSITKVTREQWDRACELLGDPAKAR